MLTRLQKLVPSVTAFGIAITFAAPVLAQSAPNGPSYGYEPAPSTNYNSAQPPYQGPGPNGPPNGYQQGRVSYVPAGMTLQASLSTAISTDVARPGDLVQAQLTQPIQLDNSVIPPGTMLIGQVASAKSGGFAGRAGQLTIKFNRLRTPSGAEVPMAAHIVGSIGKYNQIANGSDSYAGETWKNKVGQTVGRGVLGAGVGAALGTAVGAIAGHGYGFTGLATGRGAWSGAAIGGGVGMADGLLLRKGRNVTIASGTPLQLQLDAPMSISQSVQMGAF